MDRRLIARIHAGDPESAETRATIEKLYRRCLPELLRWTSAILSSHHDVEDATHDAFVRAVSELWRFDLGQPEPFRAWLRCIARRRCLDLIRKRNGLETLSLDAINGALKEPTDEGWQQPSSRLSDGPATRLLKGLPSSQHQVLALDCLGFETDEIASRLDRSPGAVRILRHRGLRTLRERLAVEPA